MATKKTKEKKATASKKKAVVKKKSTASKSKVKSKSKSKPNLKAKANTKPKAKAPVKPKVKVKTKAKSSAKKAVPSREKLSKAEAVAEKSSSKKSAPAKSVAPDSKSKAISASSAVASSAKPSRPKPKGTILQRQFMLDLAMAIKEVVEPLVRTVRGREVVGTAVSGDATFEIDRLAENALMNFLKSSRASVAYYSEDSGYSTFSNEQPKNLLIVDPIDGTRAAKNGFEGCVIAIASTRVIERPTMGDVDNACIVEIVGERSFYAERGKGARVYIGDKVKRPRLSSNSNLEKMTWSMTVPARPAELIFPTAARLIDLSSLKGGFFACNSTSYSLTRMLTNQLDASVDFAARFYGDIPKLVEDHFINAGRGAILGIAPYDMAASVLIAQEAGCHVTDAYGRKFDDVLLLDSSPANMQSMIAASNVTLHKKLLNFFDTRIKQYEALLKKRAGVLG